MLLMPFSDDRFRGRSNSGNGSLLGEIPPDSVPASLPFVETGMVRHTTSDNQPAHRSPTAAHDQPGGFRPSD